MPRRFTVPEKLTMPHPSLRVPSRDSWANLDNFYSNAPHRVKWGHTVTVEMKKCHGAGQANVVKSVQSVQVQPAQWLHCIK